MTPFSGPILHNHNMRKSVFQDRTENLGVEMQPHEREQKRGELYGGEIYWIFKLLTNVAEGRRPANPTFCPCLQRVPPCPSQ